VEGRRQPGQRAEERRGLEVAEAREGETPLAEEREGLGVRAED
jgi:hypothetical protein